MRWHMTHCRLENTAPLFVTRDSRKFWIKKWLNSKILNYDRFRITREILQSIEPCYVSNTRLQQYIAAVIAIIKIKDIFFE